MDFLTRIYRLLHTLLTCTLLVVTGITLFPARNAFAQEPSILGTYSGIITQSEFNCGTDFPGNPPLFSNAVDTNDLTLTITNQNGSSFSGSGTLSGDPGETSNISFSGTVDPSGNVSGTFNESGPDPGETSSGSFSGSISNGQFNLLASGSQSRTDGGAACDFQVNGTLDLVSAGSTDLLVNPVITPSSTLTIPLLLNTQVRAISTDLGIRIGDVLRGNLLGIQRTSTGLLFQSDDSGLNAGDGSTGVGVWASYSYSDFDNDLSSTAFDGDRHSALAGIDFSPWENTLFGVAVGYEFADVDTAFNAGNVETDGFTVAPYFGYLLTDTWSVDASFGYSSIEADQFRTSPTTSAIITSDPDSDRWFGMLNLNGVTTWNNWIIGGRLGTLWARNTQESFTESDGTFNGQLTSELGTWSLGSDVAYSYGNWEPFARVTYERDYSLTKISVLTGPQPANDRDDFLVGAGIRYFSANGISGNFEWSKRLGREDFDEDIFTLTIRGEF